MDNPSNKEVIDALFPVLLGTVFSAVKLLISKERSVFAWLTGLIVGGITGYMTHIYLADFNSLEDGAKAVIIGIAALLSNDILKGLLAIGAAFREDPFTFLHCLRTGQWHEITKKSTETTTQNQSK